MKTKINVRNFKRVESIEKFGRTFKSFYCYNYYYDEQNDILILSECDDDMGHAYFIVDEIGITFIGCGFGVYSIFDDEDDYDGEPPMENGMVELDDCRIF